MATNKTPREGYERVFIKTQPYSPKLYKRPWTGIADFSGESMVLAFQKHVSPRQGQPGYFEFFAPTHSILMLGQSAATQQGEAKKKAFFIVQPGGKIEKLNGYTDAKNLFHAYNRITEEEFRTPSPSSDLIDMTDSEIAKLQHAIEAEIKRRKSVRT